MIQSLAFLWAAATPLTEHRVADMFKPLATPAQSVFSLALLVLGITAGIFVVVGGLIVYAIVRFRHKEGDDPQEPAQVYGSNQIEVAWTVIPILIVFTLIGVTARVVASVQDQPQPPKAVHVTVVGHQWWWEFHYPDYGVVTANELHLPVTAGPTDRPSFLTLKSRDVIHSFWIPQLSGKTDVIPNHINTMWMDPREPGIFLGNCAEYCGTQHANMLLRVVAQEPADFDNWIAEQKRGVGVPADPQMKKAQRTFDTLSCVACHSVRGTPARGIIGPDLTHLMSRQTIGSGVIDNTPANLRAWIDNPQAIKPGCNMPSMKLSDQQLDQVTAYLETLK
ncbi:MAG: cytochrome c oxidase subunit II [Bryobacteraceae bacterium]